MSSFSTNIKTNDISSIAGNLVVSSQSSFTLAPHCNVIPSTADDLCNKNYVDTRLVNSGSGTNLYFNYSVADAILPYKQLGTSIVVGSSSTMKTTPQLGINAVASFITDLGYPGAVSIPAGIYELNQFGRQNGGAGGVCRYKFTLVRRTSAGVETTLGTSGFSADINTSVTDIFFAQLPLGAQTILATDRLIVNVFTEGTGTTALATIESFYQSLQYSYITTPLVSGSNFLSLNNTFTGINSFTNSITYGGTILPNIGNSNKIPPTSWVKSVLGSYATQTDLLAYVPNTGNTPVAGTKTFSSNILATGIGGTTASASFAFCGSTTSGNIDTGNLQTTGVINIGTGSRTTSGNGGAINIGTGNTCTNNLNLSNGDTHSGTVNIMNGDACSGTINLASGAGTTPTTNVNIASGTTSGAVTIGNTNSTTGLNGTVTFNNGLTLATNKFITLGSYTTAPIISQLGYTILSTVLIANGYVFLTGGLTNTNRLTLDAGTWLITGGQEVKTVSPVFTRIYTRIVKLGPPVVVYSVDSDAMNGAYSGASYTKNMSKVIQLTATTQIDIQYNFTFTAPGTITYDSIANDNTLSATRIG